MRSWEKASGTRATELLTNIHTHSRRSNYTFVKPFRFTVETRPSNRGIAGSVGLWVLWPVTTLHPNPSLDQKSRTEVLKSLLSFVQYFVPGQTRVYDIHSSSDRLNALRLLCEGKPNDARWRENRSYILGEEVAWSEDVLRVTGYVRGSQLSPDRLVHIPGHGDYQIQCVSIFTFICYLSNTKSGRHVCVDIRQIL